MSSSAVFYGGKASMNGAVWRFWLLFSITMMMNCCAWTDALVADETNETEFPNSETADALAVRRKRVLIVTSPACAACEQIMEQLESPAGAFAQLRKAGWKIGRGPENHIQIVDQSRPGDPATAKVVAPLEISRGPAVLTIEDGQPVRSFQQGCTTPLDQWTFGWLMTGHDDRPTPHEAEPITVETTGHYPLRGNHW
ncbi:MAG: hypothetical protein KDA85_16060 [Planctomycetaceae bacterium]|nr:hypothetical protein [Planctomycetaceae bacterium]